LSISNIRRIIISRTDAIGDVMLTLPLASLLKKILGSETQVIFFGRTYTKPVIDCCDSIDEFIDYDLFHSKDTTGRKLFLEKVNADAIIHVYPQRSIAVAAKDAGIPFRAGTTNRVFHWTTCNKLIRLGRKNSNLHEVLLNIKLLKSVGFDKDITFKEIFSYYHFKNKYSLPSVISELLKDDKFNLIIHPKSHASAREWSLENYEKLIKMLPEEKFRVIITGGKIEESLLSEWIKNLPSYVLNFSGKLSLEELIALLDKSDGIVAASTGPLHIAAALGKCALGIYPPIRPMDPGRWAPVGQHAEFLVMEKNCSDCRNAPESCHCMNEISPEVVLNKILKWEM
jgi:heptosyltransferase-3